jgi:pyruvate/oxaloacetate carboxyltransferase
VPRVRAELGYPPLVTPSSQIVGTQATLNVVTGKRYSMIPTEVKQYIRGYYGRPPAEIDPEVKKLAIGDEKTLDCRPADLLEPELPAAREALKDIPHLPRDEVSYALFPQYALEFLKHRAQKRIAGMMTPELEVAITAAILHMNGMSVVGIGTTTARCEAWTDTGRSDLIASRTIQYGAGKWEHSTTPWGSAGRKSIMKGRNQEGL